MMLAGRLLSDDFMRRFRAQTELHLKVVPAAELPALAGQTDSPIVLSANGEPLVRFISPSQLQLLARLHDLVGQPSLVLGIDLSRAVFLQGRQIMTYTILGTVALFFLTLAIAGLLLRRMVFVPVADLARHAFELRNSGEYSRRINNPRDDEIGKLAQAFDALLDRINVQAEELKRQSFEDALTGLKNRRFFDAQLRSAWAMLQRTNQPLSLLILDVDDFKRYNDRYGHQQGDAALHAVAQVVTDVLRRAGDTVARYGGEEFAAILPGTSAADAQSLAERVRTEVKALGLPHETSQVADVISVTIGVASASIRSDMEAEELLRLADEALYTGKHSGKNTVVLAPEPCPAEATVRVEGESL
jgi:diguanylate cyclase (GGDEF)-like protein